MFRSFLKLVKANLLVICSSSNALQWQVFLNAGVDPWYDWETFSFESISDCVITITILSENQLAIGINNRFDDFSIDTVVCIAINP